MEKFAPLLDKRFRLQLAPVNKKKEVNRYERSANASHSTSNYLHDNQNN